nr:MAG TPA: tail component [Caudoviricetes sp.]
MNAEDIKNILRNIPNSVSGDGKTFVAALKNYLAKYGLVTDEKIDSALEELTKKPNHVTNITLLELHAITDGVRSNNIQINWDMTPVNDYAKAEVWYTRAADSSWEKAGEANGTQYVMQGATAGAMYYIRVIAVNSKGVAADFDTAPMANITIKGSQYIPAPPTQFVLTWDEQGPLWKWLFEDNNYVDFFELRLDQNPGVWNDKRLDSTRETWSRANPGIRAGTAYLYVRNIFGEYSEPAVHQFNKAIGGKPAAPILTATLDGVNIKMAGLPLGYTHYKLHIVTSDGEDDYYTTENGEFIYFFFSGTITVSYCFVDDISDGEWSDTAQADVKTLMVDADNIADNAVTAAKIQANAITSTKIGAGAVTADKIEAGAITAEKLAADSVTSDAIQAGSVIGDKISAGAVTVDKLYAGDMELAGALAVVGGAVRLSQEGLRCSESSGGYTLFDERGITFYDANDNQYAQLHRICVGTAAHGQKVTFAAPWKNTPSVVCVPTELQCNEANYAQSNVFIICRATNVTVNGFSVECYTRLGEGSSTTIPYNEDYVGTTTENIKTIDKYNIEAYFDKELPVPKSATEGVIAAELTSLAAGSRHVGTHQTTYSKTTRAYKMQIIYQENVIAESEYTPLPQTSGDNYSEKLKTRQNLRFVLPSAVDYETKVTLRIVLASYKRRGYSSNNPTSVTLESDEVILISASYNSGSFAISTGVAAFVAIENGSTDYSLS